MAKFEYSAIDQSGKQRTGTVRAESEAEANSKIVAMRLSPISVSLQAATKPKKHTEKSKQSGGSRFVFGQVIKAEELTVFTRQLSTLLQAKLTLLRSLEVMIRQETNLRFKEILEQVVDEVRSGSSFSEGLSRHPKTFHRIYVNMVRAGEAGSVLGPVLSRLAGFMEKTLRTKKKVKAAMFYPIVVMGVAVTIVVLLMVLVVPKFQSIFDDMLKGAALPVPTQIVVNMSHFLRDNVLISVGAAIAVFFGFKFLSRTGAGNRLLNWLAISLPKLGDFVRKVNIARITRTFGTLLSSGVPILEAITITKDITPNIYYTNALSRVHDSVRDGESLAAPMEREVIFPHMVTSMVDVGEETGGLAEMLHRVADNYDEDVDNTVAGITSVIEPLMTVFLAVVVGFIVIALFLPIVEIIKQLTG